MDVAHAPARLLHYKHASGMVPDLLLVIRPRRQAHVDIRLTTGRHGILALAVEAGRLGRRPQRGADLTGTPLGGMAALERFAENRRRRIGTPADADRLRRAAADWLAPGTAAAQGMEQFSARGSRRGGERVGQVRAAQHTQHHPAILDQGKGHGILVPADKPLGAVDRVDRPEPAARPAGRTTASQRVEHGLHADGRVGGMHEPPDALAQSGVGEQQARFLLGNDRIGRERLPQRVDQQGLRAEIRHGHRRAVVLRDRIRPARRASDRLAKGCRAAHRRQRDLAFIIHPELPCRVPNCNRSRPRLHRDRQQHPRA